MDFDGTLWTRAELTGRLLHKDVADGRLVFDRDSGETQLLSPLSSFLVEMLEAELRPLSTAEMVRAVHAEETEASIQECLQAVEDALGALVDAGMLRAVPRLKVGELSAREFRQTLAGPGLRVATGPFGCRLQSPIAAVAPELARLYAHHELLDESRFIDFHVKVAPPAGLRRWLRPQAIFSVDEVHPFTPLPIGQALPMLEWGLNWCVTAYCHHLLVLHAATVARGEKALILPAPPGSGKSTLCAALVNRGWRLLSDELTLIDLRDGRVHALGRPVNLKNQSIDIIRGFAPEAFLSRPVHDTTKGTVAMMAPPAASVAAALDPAWPRWVVLPRWSAGAATQLTELQPGEAFLHLADNAMNYHILAEQGFEALGRLIDGARAFHFSYSSLDEAIAAFDRLEAEA